MGIGVSQRCWPAISEYEMPPSSSVVNVFTSAYYLNFTEPQLANASNAASSNVHLPVHSLHCLQV